MFTVRDQAAGAAEPKTRLASFIEQNRLPGGAAGVVSGDELVWSAGAGFADIVTGKATDLVTLYGIASITKTFTGTAIMQLRDAGRLDLDYPAVKWLPELRSLVNPFGPAEAVPVARPVGLSGTGTAHATGLGRRRPMVMRRRPRHLGFGGLSGGNVTFRRLADGRVASVLLMGSTWVRLDRVTA